MKYSLSFILALIISLIFIPTASLQAKTYKPKLSITEEGKNKILVGMSDNRFETLLDPRFQQTNIKRVRVQVAWDDILNNSYRVPELDQWFSIAQAQGVEPVVTFFDSYVHPGALPHPKRYMEGVRAFRERYPWVRHFSTWNEANFSSGQPTGRRPVKTAHYYKRLKRYCQATDCQALTVDYLANGTKKSKTWLKKFKKNIGPGPHLWGLVTHPDVNRGSLRDTQWFLKHTKGNVWITETGAISLFSTVYKPNVKRQTKAMKFLMNKFVKVSPRIKRMYMYHWKAPGGDATWDSALLNVKGKPRPAYFEFFKALGIKPPL